MKTSKGIEDKGYRIIVLPGELDALFFFMELGVMKRHFQQVTVISYPFDPARAEQISHEQGVDYRIVSNKVFSMLFKASFYKWLFSKPVRQEIKSLTGSPKDKLVKLAYLVYYGVFFLQAKAQIEPILEDGMPTVLYSYWLSRGAYAISAFHGARRENVRKIISRAHGYDLYEERNRMNYLPFRSFINENLDQISFISHHGMAYFTAKYPADLGAHKSVAYLGARNPEALRKVFFNPDKIVIASCSMINQVKRLDLIIDFLAACTFDFEWIHLGSGELEEHIRTLAEQKLPAGSYAFLGEVDNQEVLSIYQEHNVDVLINLSDSEGIPLSIMEAISMGIPVIARDVGGIAEIVSDQTGYLIRSPEETLGTEYALICQTLLQMQKDPACFEAKKQACIERWQSAFDADQNYEAFFSSLRESLE